MEKKVITAPRIAWDKISKKLKEWGLPPLQNLNPREATKRMNFFHLLKDFSRRRKFYLLKLLLNDNGLDVVRENNVFKLILLEDVVDYETNSISCLEYLSKEGCALPNNRLKSKKRVLKSKSERFEQRATHKVKDSIPFDQIKEADSERDTSQEETEEVSNSVDEESK